MPTMTGTEFLAEALPLQPDAKRVLLTAYADTDVAIRAINEIRLDQYLLKPWDPPEEKLYPVLDDLLADWAAGYRPAFEGLRLLSGRWAPRGHEIRDFLTRNQVPYTWLDPETDEDGRRLAASLDEPLDPTPPGRRPARRPQPARSANRELADAIGMSTHAAPPVLRPRHRRRRAGRAGRRGVRRQRGAEDAHGRARGAGRPGRHDEPDRELPRLPVRPERQRPRASGADPGEAPRRRDPLVAGGDDDSARGSVSVSSGSTTARRSRARP